VRQDDKKAVHKMIRRLIKRGTWERHALKPGRLQSITCGPVKIERWRSSNEINVWVDGVLLCDSNSQYSPWRLAAKAKAFFFRHAQTVHCEHLAGEFSAARLALLRSVEDSEAP
jgi:hypothetical protein